MIDSLGIHVGPIYIRFYALFLIAGMLAGLWLTAQRAARRGLNTEHIWNGFFWALLPGLIGARLYHVLTPSPASGLTTEHYLQNPLEILAIWKGGLGIYGAILGGFLGIVIYGLRQKEPIIRWLDVIAPGMALGQAIGRWGNFVNQELYGAPSDLPWAISIDRTNRLPGYESFERFHPLFLYESLWMVATCLILIYVDRRWGKRLRNGAVILLYLMSYALIRFLLDFVRLDSHTLGGGLTTAQVISFLVFILAGGVILIRQRIGGRESSTAEGIPAE
ncbi:MAG TPA: prolipoprotein diacylglyceryl transferase [Aggregatilineales bacterium]|nr:prolipoprotein diacylglyceryl transferase [Anaerolineales bacterium]HRE48189.1 prolipoprotein diacylglyceryl transferase [Aggregatilineales bacterium]